MKILIIIMLIFTFKSSLSSSEEVKMMECKLFKTMRICNPGDAYCDTSIDTESYKNKNYNLLKYVKGVGRDEIYYRNEGKWKIFTGLDLPANKKEVMNYTGYYKFVVDGGNQVFEFWFDFFYPSRKWSHTVLSTPFVYDYKCRKYQN